MRKTQWQNSRFIVLALLFLVANINAQTLKLVTRFSDVATNIQFAPGGYVILTDLDDGRKRHYIYQDSTFLPFQGRIPPEIEAWNSFDWGSVDVLDSIDIGVFHSEFRTFLPKAATVKKVLYIHLPKTKKPLILVCYTLVPKEDITTRDIYITGILDSRAANNQPVQYRKLWTKRVEHLENYGEFTYQDIPGMGIFVLLYAAEETWNSEYRSLDVYRIEEN